MFLIMSQHGENTKNITWNRNRRFCLRKSCFRPRKMEPLRSSLLPYNCTLIFDKVVIARLTPKRYRCCLPYNCNFKNPQFWISEQLCAFPAEVTCAIKMVSQTVRNVKSREEREQPPSFSCEWAIFPRRRL